MLIKAANKKSVYFLFLLTILYIAAGIPLLHPALHDHLDQGHLAACSCNDGCQVTLEAESHECPLCDLLARSQYHPPEGSHVHWDGLATATVFSKTQFLITTSCLESAKPRAPPAPLFS
jgi:hypothetical protein